MDLKGPGDLYRGMEVSVVAGNLKMHYGTVKGTREKSDKVVVDVLMSTQMVNTLASFNVEDVRER